MLQVHSSCQNKNRHGPKTQFWHFLVNFRDVFNNNCTVHSQFRGVFYGGWSCRRSVGSPNEWCTSRGIALNPACLVPDGAHKNASISTLISTSDKASKTNLRALHLDNVGVLKLPIIGHFLLIDQKVLFSWVLQLEWFSSGGNIHPIKNAQQ